MKITKTAFFLFVIVIFGYFVTWHGSFEGYEAETAQAAQQLLSGHYELKRAGLASVVLYIPFVVAQKIIPALGESVIKIVPVVYSSLLIVVLYWLGIEFASKRRALLVALLVAFGSMVWPYANAGMEYQLTLALAVLLLALKKYQRGQASGWFVAAAVIFVTLTKSYGIIFIIPAALYIRGESAFRTIIVPGLLACGMQLLLNKLFLHSFSGFYNAAHEFQIVHWWEGWYGFLFSFGKSIFIYNPLLVVAAFLYPRFMREHKKDGMFLLNGVLLLMLVNAPFVYWSDETWGPRKLLPIIPLLHLPLILIQQRTMRILTGILFAIALYVQLLGSLYNYGTYLKVLRAMNMDSLITMRYLPEFSHPAVFEALLISYMGGQHELRFSEESWFRWTNPGQTDISLRGATIDIRTYHRPDVWWLKIDKFWSKH